MSDSFPWYHVEKISLVDSPSLLIYPDRVRTNIQHMKRIAGDPIRLRPHVKTHKMAEIADMHIQEGISRFKCATLAEAEMLAQTGVSEILLAHQPVGPKIGRITNLAGIYPKIRFSVIADTESVIRALSAASRVANVTLEILIDLDNGMHRSGIEPGQDAIELYHLIDILPNIQPGGLHVYDGHFRHSDFALRKAESDAAFEAVWEMVTQLEHAGLSVPRIIAGGSPTFPVHALRERVELSPGTYVFWDAGYGEKLPDLPFEPAALVVTRIISKPGPDRLCLDLGHKAIASENPLPFRVRFLNLDVLEFLAHSEEHMVVSVAEPNKWQVGDVIYGVPWHVCPTVALHQEGIVIKNHQVTNRWKVVARDRRILLK